MTAALAAILCCMAGGARGKAETVVMTEVSDTERTSEADQNLETEEAEMGLTVTVNGVQFKAEFEKNAAVDALKEKLADGELTLTLTDYSGFEKVGSFGFSLPTENRQTTTKSGDIVLYNGSQLVIFYGSNSWSYTRLARISDLTDWEKALGRGDAEVVLSLAE